MSVEAILTWTKSGFKYNLQGIAYTPKIQIKDKILPKERDVANQKQRQT